jgi:hypothetical protein
MIAEVRGQIAEVKPQPKDGSLALRFHFCNLTSNL